MLSFLKRHPFPVIAHFDFSLVLTYTFPEEILKALLPPHLELDTFAGQGFVAVAMVETKKLRPTGFPEWMGNEFFLIGYRIFVKYNDKRGRRLRGLYILGSQTNRKLMQFTGNLFTHYNYSSSDIQWTKSEKEITVLSKKTDGTTDFEVAVHWKNNEIALPENSVFVNWKEARRFAGPLPFTFDFETKKNQMIIIEGVRENWEPRPVEVTKANISFLQNPQFQGVLPILANAFVIENIPYSWKKGKIEKW